MPPERAQTHSTLDLSHSSISISLEPIRTFGSAALDPYGQPDVNKVTLRQLQIARENALHEVLTIASDDLLKSPKSPAAAAQSIPADGTLAAATFDFQFTDCDRPHAVEIRPPGTIHLEFPTDAPRVLAWLITTRFQLASQLANTAAIIFLALAAAFVPALADGDDDDDDLDNDRHNHRPTRVHSFAHARAVTLPQLRISNQRCTFELGRS